jgi:diacylglycerol O-acyltransferase
VAVDPGRSARRIGFWRQLVLGLTLVGVYLGVDTLRDESRRAGADRHGRDISALEQHLHLDVERTLNSWLAKHHVLATLANYEYAITYIVSTVALIVWIYVRCPDVFRQTRDSFVLLNVLGIGCFALYPVTPMPSLHAGWALWVSVVLARLAAWRSVQVFSAVHVIVTFLVTVATANHYVLDAVAAVALVAVSVLLAGAWHDRASRPGLVVPSCDAFFLHVETAMASQQVGGLVVFEPADDEALSLERVREVVRDELERLPRFRQRLAPPSRWRRPRWVDVSDIDWPLHISERRSADGLSGLRQIVAELVETHMSRDHPLWRLVMVRDVGPGQSAMVLLMHHVVADGIGTVIQALNLLRPRIELPSARGPVPGRAQLAGATIAGLARLATDGGARGGLAAASSRREFATADLDLAAVRRVASARGVRVTDLLVALTADALATSHHELAARLRGRLRVAVPLMVREPGVAAESNATAAVMVDVPVDGRPFEELLAVVGRHTARLRTPSRAVASRFVMTAGLRALPEPCAAWFARTVYGRRFFHAIVSNMPGSTLPLSMATVSIARVYPILPLAPGAPIALGALSWAGSLGIGLATDPASVDAEVLAARMELTLSLLEAPVIDGGISRDRPHESEEESRA